MPKEARAASRVHKGGRGARRVQSAATPSGRARSSPRMTAAAAVVVSAQLHLLATAHGKTLLECIVDALTVPQALAAFMAGAEVAAAARAQRELIQAYMADKQAKVLLQPGRANAIAVEVRERIRAHAGPPQRVAAARTPSVGPPAAPGAWLGQAPAAGRKLPPPDGRMLAGIKAWRMGRLGPLPPHTVVCYERAAGRVQEWRARTGAAAGQEPPLALYSRCCGPWCTPTRSLQPWPPRAITTFYRCSGDGLLLRRSYTCLEYPRATRCIRS